jgi:hypothetical protein
MDYSQFGFWPLEAVEGRSAAKPSETPMFLALKEIEAARKK